jgi:hypothetical protein
MVNTVNTMVNTGVHTQPTDFHRGIHLVNTVNTYSGKDWWEDTEATGPMVDSAQALQWGKGVHGIHRVESGSDYIGLYVNPFSRRCSPFPWGERSRLYRDYRRYRSGSLPSGRVGGNAEPRSLPLHKYFHTGKRNLPPLPRGLEQ